jgi:hypothetical protein
VGLAAAEVGLQLDHRVAALPPPPAHRVEQQLPQPVGEEGPAEELGRVAVLRRCLVPPDLMEVRGELRLLVATRRDVRVRRDQLPPRPQATGRLPLDRNDRRPALRLAGLLGETDPEQLLAHPVSLQRLVGGRN